MKFILSALYGILATQLFAQVVINEIVATTAPRNLRWDDRDQPYAGAGPAWWSGEFDDSRWEQGMMPLGFSASGISTDLGSELRNVSPSFYARKTFEVSNAEALSTESLILGINYNDGFIAWVNGVEIARRNMGAPKAHIYHDQLAYRGGSQSTATEEIELTDASDYLVEGENVLAVQVNNFSISSGMRLDASLSLELSGGGDKEFISAGSEVSYLPGLREPTSDLGEPNSSDWIELHHSGASSIDLSGWSLSDDPELPEKWEFPNGTTIPAGGYLVILADGSSEQVAGSSFLHANFKLSGGGEPLALINASGQLVSQFDPEYPRQYPNLSYGIGNGGELKFFANPTPGKANDSEQYGGRADSPDFSQRGGFYDSAVTVSLTSETPNATIRYTTDGSEPTLENGLDYQDALTLDRITTRKGHVIRARAFRNGFIQSKIKTHSFLIGQDARVRDNPSLVFAGDAARALYDPFGTMAINGGRYSDNRWQPTGPSDYNNVINRGRSYERAIHAEFYFPDGSAGFRSDVGLRVASSSYSRPRMMLSQPNAIPWPSSPTQKPSFNLYFRDDYGNPSVDLPLAGATRDFSSYERFRIRAGKNDIRNPFVIDELFRRLSHDMSGAASLGVLNTLYVNGELKGYYNMVERLREPFFRSLHNSEPDAQWDVLQFEGNDNIAEGDKVAWNDMIDRLNDPMTPENWAKVLEVADVDNIANYFLLNIYGATWDWPHNNWVAAKERSEKGRYRLYVWDAEGAMNNAGPRSVSQEMIRTFIKGTSNGAGGQNGTRGELRDLWNGLNRWEEFRLVFADRINEHMFNGGILDDQDPDNSHVKMRFDELADDFSGLLRAIQNQSIQTGDVARWISPTSGRRQYLFGPRREEFRDNNLWPELTPPIFSKFGGDVESGAPLLITNEAGLVYYTTDGSDPRLVGGSPNPEAVSQPGSLLEVELFPAQSIWKYRAEGDEGTAWRAPAFDDSSWLEGNGPLGYGSITEKVSGERVEIVTTVNAIVPRQPTTYFRKEFEIERSADFLEMTMSLQVDGGVIVYVNGVEAFRESNIPEVVTYETEPTSDSSDGNEGDFVSFEIEPGLLRDGRNIIAVELHNKPTSSDMVFDMQLSARRVNDANLPVFIDQPLTLKARSFSEGTWSALTEANFTVDASPASSSNIAVAEILYNPVGPSDAEEAAGYLDGDVFEYLRIENLGAGNVDLSEVRFNDGISFDFQSSNVTSISSGGVVLLVKNIDAFRFRFGSQFDDLIAGEYDGQLSNGGESLRLVGSGDQVIHEFSYETVAPWPLLGDLDGHSIQIIDRNGNHDDGSNWVASANVGGSPDGSLDFDSWREMEFSAAELGNVEISGPGADPDGDGASNFEEFALGSIPTDSASRPSVIQAGIETIGGDEYLVLSFDRPSGNRRVDYQAEVSENLESWQAGGRRIFPEIVNPDGSIKTRFQFPSPLGDRAQFLRLKTSGQ